jgi:L-ribulose-5-phosphate 3-epimerase
MKAYSIGLYEKALPASLSWREKFDAAKNAAYDFLEISIDESDEKLSRLSLGRRELRSIWEEADGAGLPIRTLCLSAHRKYPLGSEDEKTRARSLEIMEKALDLAVFLGVRVIQLAGYDVYYEPSTEKTRGYFAENLRRAVEMAASRGVLLAFETMETPFMNTVEKAMRYVRLIDSPYLAVYPDAGNITNAAKLAGGNALSDLDTGKGHIAALHLKESADGRYREVPYGQGHVDFVRMIQRARALGAALFVTEFWHTGEADWRESVARSKAFIDEAFRRALDARS